MNDKMYIVMNSSEIGKINFTQIDESSEETLRKSLNLSKTLIKWSGEQPEFISTLSEYAGPYDHASILTVLSGTEWTNPNSPLPPPIN